eukprot:286635-Amphidinium_carterae.1
MATEKAVEFAVNGFAEKWPEEYTAEGLRGSLDKVSIPWGSASTTWRIGLCTAHMNRLWQVKLALPLTLAHCLPHKDHVCIYFVDFDGVESERTRAWIDTECHWAIVCGLLRVSTSDALGYN